MNLRLVIVALFGVGLALYLIFYVGFGAVLSAALTVGWSGFALLIGLGLANLALVAMAWHVLVQGFELSRFAIFLWGRTVRDSAAEVLPFSQLGGFVIGARAVILKGVAAPIAFASTIVDVTTEMMAQIAYVGLGIVLLSLRAPESASISSLRGVLVLGVVAAAIAGSLFIVVQRSGMWITEKLASRWIPENLAHATAVAASVDAMYRKPLRIGASFAIHLCAWLASAGITWAAFGLMGTHIDFLAVVAIDSLVYAARSAAFVVPNALGVQEAAYAALTSLFGIGPELGLAVSLLKRARDIAIGVPVLLLWQAMEGRRALVSERNVLTTE